MKIRTTTSSRHEFILITLPESTTSLSSLAISVGRRQPQLLRSRYQTSLAAGHNMARELSNSQGHRGRMKPSKTFVHIRKAEPRDAAELGRLYAGCFPFLFRFAYGAGPDVAGPILA